MKPGLIPEHASLDPNNGLENTKKAMDLAEEHLNIPQVLKPENLAIAKPDELSVITYLSYYCNKESPGKDSLLEWVRSKIPENDITNFTSDWRDGQALGALTDVISGGNFPDSDDMDPSTPLENAQKSMDYAESHLGVPKVITPEQFVDSSLDALPMMTYLTHFRNAKATQFTTDMVNVTGPGISGGIAGQETNFIIKGRIPNWAKLDVSVTSPTGEKLPIQRHAPAQKVVKCTYTPVVPGNHKVEVNINKDPVPHSPFIARHIEPTDSISCFAVGPGLDKARVGEKAEFTANCKSGGPGELQVEVQGPSGNVETDVAEDSDHLYTANFTPNEAGEHTVGVLWAGKHISGSPFTCQVTDPKKCTASGKGLSEPYVSQPNTFQVKTRGAGSGNLQVKMEDPNGSPLPVSVEETGSNTYNCSYTPTTKGDHTIDITWADGPISGSPFHVYPKDAANASKCKAHDLPTGLLRADKEASFAVDVEEAGEGELQASGSGPSLPAKCEVRKKDADSYTVAFTPVEVGPTNIKVTFADENIPDSPFQFKVNDPTKCHVNKAAIEKGDYVVNQPIDFQVSAQLAGEGDVTTKVTGPKGDCKVDVKDQNNGTFFVHFTPITPGNHGIDIFFDGEQIPESPMRIFVDTDVPDVVVTEPAPGRLGAYVVDSPYIYKIDASGARNAKLTATGHGSRHGAQPILDVSDLGDKHYTVTVEAQTPDDYQIHIKWGENPVPNSPFTLPVVDKARPEKVSVSGPYYKVGSPSVSAVVDTTEAGAGELSATCAAMSSGSIPVSVTKKEDKVFDVALEAPPEECTLTILWSEEQVPDSPFFIDLVPPDASKVRVTGPEYSVGSPMVTAAVDASRAGNGELSAKCRGKALGDIPVKINQKEKRVYDVEFEAAVPDEIDFEILWSDEHVPRSPYSIDLRPSEADKVRIDGPHYQIGSPEVSATVDALQAGNGELTAECRGKKLGNVPVEISEKEKGVYDIEVKPSEPDDLTLGILWSGNHIPRSPFNVDLVPPDASKVRVTGPEYNVGSPLVTAAVDASQAGNGELSAKCRGKVLGDIPVKVHQKEKRVYDVEFEAAVPDEIDFEILWSDEQVPRSPYSIDLRPSEADKVRIDGPHYQIGSPEVAATVDALQAGNGELSAKCRGKKLGNVPVEISEKEKGVFDVKVEPSEPDDLTLGILWSGNHIPSSPFNIDLRPPDASKVRVAGPEYSVGSPLVTAAVDASRAGNGELSAKCRGKNIGDVPVKITEKEQGDFNVEIEADQPDELDLDILWSGAHVPRSPFSIDLRPSEADKVHVDGPKYEIGSPEVTADIDASQAGTGELTASCSGKKIGPVPVSIQPKLDHQYEASVHASEPDEYTLNILWSERHVPGSPYHMDLRPPDASKVHVTEPDSYAVDLPAVYKIDTSEAGVGTLSAACHYGKFGSLPVDIKELTNHKYTATVVPKEPIDYNLSIEWSGQHVKQSPFKIHLLPDVHPENVVCSDIESSLVAQPVFLTADATEAGPGKLTASCEGKQSGTVPVTVEETRPNIYKVSFIPGQEDDYSLAVYYEDQPVPKSPFDVGIHPIVEEPIAMELMEGVEAAPMRMPTPLPQPELEMLIGDPLDITLDQESTSEDSPAEIRATATGDKTGIVDLSLQKNESDDTYALSFNPSQPDRYVIEVKSGDRPVPASPIVVIYSRLFDSSKCFITDLPFGSSPPVVDSEIKFSVDATEAGKAELVVVSNGPSGEKASNSEITEEPNRRGYYRIKYTPTAPGDHRVHLTFGGDKIPGSPLYFAVEGGSAISGVHVYPYGKPVQLHLQAESKLRNIEAFAVQVENENRRSVKVSKAKEKNKFNLTFLPLTPGFYDVHVFLSKARVAGCPYRIQYLPPPDAEKVSVTVTPNDIAYVHEPIQFNIDAKDAGNAELVLRANVRKQSPEDFSVVDNGDGTYASSYTPKVADRHKFDVLWGDREVPGSPFVVSVVHRPPDVSHLLTKDLNLIQMGSIVDVHFDLTKPEDKDSIVTQAKGKKVGDVDWKLQSLDEGTKFRAHFNSAAPDDYILEIKFEDNLIEGSPYFVKVVGMGALEPTMPISDVDVPSVVDVGEPVNFLLKTDLENVHGSELDVNIEGPEGASPDSTTKGDMQGLYAINFTPENVGDYLVHVKHDDSPILGSPFRITAQQVSANAEKCHVVADDLPLFAKSQRFGKPCKFRISTIDAGRGTLNITTRGPGKAEVKIFDEGDGVYACELTPSVAGTYNVDITWDDEPIQGSPYQLSFKEKKKRVITGLNLEAEHFRIGVPHRFKLHCDDLGTGILEVKCKPPSAAKVRVTVADKDAYQVELVPVEEGHHEVSVQYNGLHIAGSPFNVTFNRKGDPSKCHMVRSEVEQNEDGEDVVVFVVSTEGAGLGKLTANVDNVRGGEVPTVNIQELDEPYTHRVEFLLGDGTEYMLNINYDDEHIDGSPFKLLFDPKPSPDACKAEGDGLKTSLVGREAKFTVNTAGAGAGELDVTITMVQDDTTIEPKVVKDNDECTCTYTPAVTGDYEISVKWGEVHIPSSPFQMKCYHPSAQSASFSVNEPPTNSFLGQDIAFTVKSSEEDEIEKGELLVSAESNTDNITGRVTYEGFGSYHCTLTPTNAGKHMVSVKWNGENIDGSPFRVKVGLPPRPDLVKAYGPGLQDGFVGQEGNFTLETAEAGSGTLAVRLHGPKGAFKINMRHHPDNDRTILVRYDPKYVGEYTIDVTWSDQHIPNSPFKVNIQERKESSIDLDDKTTEED